MHSFFTKEVSEASRFLATPGSLRTHANAFPTGILASIPTGETKLLPLSKVADKLGGYSSLQDGFHDFARHSSIRESHVSCSFEAVLECLIFIAIRADKNTYINGHEKSFLHFY